MTAPEAELVMRVAGALARALDRNDFMTARQWIAADCCYEVRGETVAGVDAILVSYADGAEWATRQFDEVRYESEVGTPAGATVAVLYTDYLLKAGGRWHRHRCRQHLTVGVDDLVVRIVHEDLEGQPEALEAYFKECGIER